MRAGGKALVRGVWGIAALVLPLWAAGHAVAETPHGSRIAMPFSCAVERGRVRVQPGPEQIYEIADRADSYPFTACPAGPSRQCRTFTVHRFTLSCPGGRAPWVEVVAAAAAMRPDLLPRVELEDGRLLLGHRRTAMGMVRDCYARLSGTGPRVRIYDPLLQDECWSPSRRGAAPRVELPMGYAPLMLARARLVPVQRPPATPVALTAPVPAPAATAGDAAPAQILPPSRAPSLSPAPATTAADDVPATESSAVARFAITASSWRTEVMAGDAARVVEVATAERISPLWPTPPTPTWMIAIAAALVGSSIVTWGLVARGPLRSHAPARAGAVLKRSDARAVDSLKASGLELLPVIRDRLDHLPAAMPLRQVLARELHTAAQRFAVLAAEQPHGREAERRNRSRLQVVVRDLKRLAEITEGAQSSLGGQALVPAELPEPQDKTEAYALLGVNPDVNERILKKLVEALRQSWHPDLARDDADRRRREDRIKQINVAWDLIQGKRVEA